jgi:hypothetical protein
MSNGFINVPNVPGVPPLPSYSPNNVALLFADAVGTLLGVITAPQWGIYLNGAPVLSYDNQVSFGYKQDWKISTYSVEQGSFQTYDKVQLPSEIRCRFSAGASVVNRQMMLASIDAVMSDTNLYDVVTPEKVYLGYNFMHRDYDRDAESAGMVVVDIWLMEIIETATAQFQSTQSPTNAGQQGLGNVPTQAPSPAVQGQISANGVL